MPSSQKYSTSVRCRRRPSKVRGEGGDAASLSCSGARPEHFHSSVSRCASRKAFSMARSSPLRGTSVRPLLAMTHLHSGVSLDLEYTRYPYALEPIDRLSPGESNIAHPRSPREVLTANERSVS